MFKQVFLSLRHRNLRLFLIGQLFSVIGVWMQIVAGAWLIYRMSDSPFLLGVFAFVQNFPALVFSPFAGIAADRFDRRSLLVLINTLSMVQAFILWVLVVTGHIQVWHIMCLSIFIGILNAFEMPVRQSLISKLIDEPKDLPNAIALNSSVFNGSRLIGPAIAGVVISVFGESVCFFINAISFLPVIVLLCLMILPVVPVKKRNKDDGFQSGVKYVIDSMPLRSLLFLVAILSMTSAVFHALAPVFAKEIFQGGPKTLGLLLSSTGIGAFLSAIYLASRKTVLGLSRIVSFAGIGLGGAYIMFALVNNVMVASIFALIAGACMIMAIGGMNVMIQTIVDERMRGRVMSFYAVALIGISPFGSMLAGWVASHRTVNEALAYAGCVAIFFTVSFMLQLPTFKNIVRSIYVEKGIIPEVR